MEYNMSTRPLIYIIDPQSVNSLGIYDYEMVYGIRDFEIHLFGNCGYNYKPFDDNVKFSPVFKYGCYSNPILKGLSYVLTILIIILWGIREKPQIMHFQWVRIFSLDFFMVRFFQKVLGTKVVFTVHNILPRKRKKNTFRQFNKLYHACNLLISHTNTCKGDLIKQFKLSAEKITVMPHGCIDLNISEEEISATLNQFKSNHNVDDKIIFSSLGVQNSYKGTDLIFDAWLSDPELRLNDNLRLIIAGKPSGIEIPKQLPANVIIIPRLLTNAEFEMFIRITDVALLPYRAIEQSGVLLTLIQNRKPYCCSKVGELAKPFETASVGWVFNELTVESIATTLKYLSKSPEMIDKKKNDKIGWDNVQELYSWRKSNRILNAAYHTLI